MELSDDKPRRIRFGLPQGFRLDKEVDFRNYESNHHLPFVEDTSAGIVLFARNTSPSRKEMYVVPVKAFLGFQQCWGKGIPWNEWRSHAIPLNLSETPRALRVLNSHVVCIQVAVDDLEHSKSKLCIFDFSNDFRAEEITLEGVSYYDSVFEFTEGGLLVKPVRICIVAMHDEGSDAIH